ncbi:MAG TPA: hypothetical protein VG890_12010 [Puia sp.]|nr:hypothetical protein [Puia sp.]
MTFILGLLSVFQALFLPGYLISRFFFPLKGKSKLLVAFGISLLFNYQFVLLLTAIGLYGRPAVFILFALECLSWIWLSKRKPMSGYSDKENLAAGQLSNVQIKGRTRTVFTTLFAAVSFIVVLGVVSKILGGNPGIFDSWDDVLSWNRWAAEWYNGHLPAKTYHYPQLIPANWSMMYQFVGTPEIQFFAKSIMALFALGILLAFYDLYKKLSSDFFLAALAWSGFLLLNIVGSYIGTGYMDIPVTFFCLITFYMLALTSEGLLPVFSGLLLAAVFLAAALLIKQAGLAMIPPFVCGCIIILYKAHGFSVHRKTLIVAIISACILLAGPWYLYKQIQMNRGTENSEVSWVTKDIYAGKTKMQRLQDASAHFKDAVTEATLINALPETARPVAKSAFFALLLALSLLSLLKPYSRFVLLLLVIPYYLIWAIYFSYDLRNVSLLIPFWGFSLGVGSQVCFDWMAITTPRSRKRVLWPVLGLAIVMGAVSWPGQKLRSIERRMAMERLMDSGMNRLLYQRYDSGMLKGKILCSYPMMAFLPDLKDYVQPFSFDSAHLDTLKLILPKEIKSYPFCLLQDGSAPEVWEYFKQLDSQGYIKSKIKTDPGWNLIELKPNP